MRLQKTIRRLTAWLLSAVMMLGSMPLALAEDVTTPDEADACPHENTKTEYTRFNARDYQDSGDGIHHTFLYDKETIVTCLSCSSVVSQTTGTGLNGYGEHEGDPCSLCGYSTGCQHENAVVTTEERTTQCELDPNNPEKQDEIHIRYYDVYEVTTCPDCGYTSEVEVGSGYGPQEHVGNPCSLCGYSTGCQHENAVVSTGTRTTQCELDPNNPEKQDEIHIRYYDVYEVTTCPDCGYTSEVKVGSGYEPQEHVGDPCSLCGYALNTPSPEETPSPDVTTVPEPLPTTCPHSSWHTETEDTGIGFEWVDASTDRYVCTRVEKKICDLCSEMFERTETPYQDEPEAHIWNTSGQCRKCFGMNPCEHTSAYIVYFEKNVQYMPNEGGTHTRTFDRMAQQKCPDCGMEWEAELDAAGQTATEEHSYGSDGLCQYCRAASTDCAHANVSVYEYQVNHQYSADDNSTHTVTYDVMRTSTCRDCGLSLGEEKVITGKTRTERHSWSSDGVCYDCNARNSCEHARMMSDDHDSIESWTDNGDGTHTVTYTLMRQNHCPDCDMWFASETVASGLTRKESHSWSAEGLCYQCQAENDCEHRNVEINEYRRHISSSDNGDGTHTTTYNVEREKHCFDCGQYYASEVIAAGQTCVENHSDTGFTGDNRCAGCGAENRCAHERTEAFIQQDNAVYTDNGDGTHTVTYDKGTQTHCLDCGFWFDTVYTEKGLQRTEKHSWNEQGVCWACNAKNACTHEYTETIECSRNWEYRDNGDGKTHTMTYEKGTRTHCLDCGAYYGEVWEGAIATETVNHNWNSEGFCWDCNAKNACTHEHTRTEYGIEGKQSAKDNGDGTHLLTYSVGNQTHCEDCGWYDEVVWTENGLTRTENHGWTPEGTCWACNAVNPCTHENRRVETVVGGEITYTDNENGTHTMRFDQGQQEFCRSCHQPLSDVEWTELGATRIENHEWDENGSCRACGAVNTCPHENTQVSTYEVASSYKDNNDGTHTETYDTVKVVHCRDCYSNVSRETLETGLTRTVKHSWDNEGICWGCGAKNTCAHANRETEESGRDYVYEDNGDNTHKVTFERGTREHCLDCGQWFEMVWTGETVTEYKPHNWEDEGICWHCGAKNTCPHEHVEENDHWRFDDDTVITDNGDGKTHTITAMTMIDRVCRDCGQWLGEEENGVKTWSDIHEYVEGGTRCDYCEFVNTCTHPSMAPEELWYDVVWTDNGDGKTHTTSYALWTVDTCPDCGWMNWDTETYVKDCTEVQEHWFEDGYCTDCFADAPEETPAPEETQTPEPVKTATPAPAQTAAPSGGNGGGNGGTTNAARPDADIDFIATPEPVATAAPEMVSTLLDTVAQAETEGSEVSVEVVGAQEVFSETEYEQLKTLPAQEQMLVTLASIGLEDVVQSALTSMDMTLSAEAETLTAQVTERFAAMGEEERAQVEEKLTQLFPKTEVTVGGVTYEYFVVDLEITVDGKVRVERYGFRYDEELGQWVFEKLDLVDMYVQTA